MLDSCQDGTNASLGLRGKVTLLQQNVWATFGIVMTHYLIFMTPGKLLIEHSLYNTLQGNRAARRSTSESPKPTNFFLAQQPPVGEGLLTHEVFYITHNYASQSIGLLWTSDQLVAKTSTWQHTILTTVIHAPGGIRTHNLSRRGATDLCFRRRGHWNRQNHLLAELNNILHR